MDNVLQKYDEIKKTIDDFFKDTHNEWYQIIEEDKKDINFSYNNAFLYFRNKYNEELNDLKSRYNILLSDLTNLYNNDFERYSYVINVLNKSILDTKNYIENKIEDYKSNGLHNELFRLNNIYVDLKKEFNDNLEKKIPASTSINPIINPQNGLEEKQKEAIILQTENTFIKGMPLDNVRKFFKLFKDKNSKNGLPFLTEEQFENFIQLGFTSNKEIEKVKINYVKGEKGKVINLFYRFYVDCVTQYNIKDAKEPFINLVLNTLETSWTYPQVKSLFKLDKTKNTL